MPAQVLFKGLCTGVAVFAFGQNIVAPWVAALLAAVSGAAECAGRAPAPAQGFMQNVVL